MSGNANAVHHRDGPRRVAIVGGGLAGLAITVALADSRLQRKSNCTALEIELFESRRMLGGRATSYRDPENGELIDNCQHVSLGCCTNFDDFCRRTGIDHLFKCESCLNFVGPDAHFHVVAASKWLPAPLHLAPSLLRLSYLSLRERLAVGTTLLRLARSSTIHPPRCQTFGQWLRMQGQSERALKLFWSPVIVSALSEEMDRASYAACRKVFVDAFLRHREGYRLKLPNVPLRTLYEEHLAGWLRSRGVKLHLAREVRSIELGDGSAQCIVLADGARRDVDFISLAVPWYRVAGMFDAIAAERWPLLRALNKFDESPITSVHLWCRNPLRFRPRHAVLPGRFSQWIFNRTYSGSSAYYQVVISASRDVASMSRDEVVACVCAELQDICGDPVSELVARAKVITEHRAVFSPTLASEQLRVQQRTPFRNLFLAGDWTATGWPATMEGAVRSGYLAAEAVLEEMAAKETFVVPDLPAALLARWLLGIQ